MTSNLSGTLKTRQRSRVTDWRRSLSGLESDFFPQAPRLPRSRQIVEWGCTRSRQRADVLRERRTAGATQTMHPESSTVHNSGAVEDRRKHGRVRAKIPCELIVKGYSSSMRIHTSDLSVGGCYVEMMFTLPVGTPLELRFWIDEVRIDCSAVVATCDPQVGNGIKFLVISPKDEVRIQAFVYNLCQAQT